MSGEHGRRGEIDLADGKFVTAKVDGAQGAPTEVLRELLRWKVGSFAFKPDPIQPALSPGRQSLTGLLLEATRLEDEARR